jgi:hypothetical protein
MLFHPRVDGWVALHDAVEPQQFRSHSSSTLTDGGLAALLTQEKHPSATKASGHFAGFSGTTEVVPFQNSGSV